MDCPQCGATDVIEIKHRLPEDIELYFFSCHRCEERWWDRDGQVVALREVLEMARQKRR
jgi:transposase-like protein